MTLHAMTIDHYPFVTECFKRGGMPQGEAEAHSIDLIGLALSYAAPVFFVGPTAETPRYYLGAYIDITGRAHLAVGTTDFDSAPSFKDAHEWFGYILNELGVNLLEAYVWVEDLPKEWYLRALGFKKAGIIPEKVDIPGKGRHTAVSMFIRPEEFNAMTPETFRGTIKKYKAHRDKLRRERVK